MVKETNKLSKDTARLKQLKIIKKEIQKRNRLKDRFEKQEEILSKLLEEYQMQYLI